MKQKKQAKVKLKFEVIDAEPMTEEQLDALADLFAEEIIHKMLNKNNKAQNTQIKGDKITHNE